MALLAGLAATLAGAAVQASLGFGFAMLTAPVLAVTMGPRATVAVLSVLGVVSNALVLGGERHRLAVERRTAKLVIIAAVPGTALGALVLSVTPTDPLKIFVSVVVLAAVVLQARGSRRPAAPPAGDGWAAASGAGALAGALGTTTGLSGPPLVLYLLRRQFAPRQIRDTLAAVFLVMCALALVSLAIAGTLTVPREVFALIVAAAVGQALGRIAFVRLEPRHEPVTLAALVLCSVVALAPAVEALT